MIGRGLRGHTLAAACSALALAACTGREPPSDSDTDTAVSLREGDPCDPAADACSDGTVCCTQCCRTDALPVCTVPDAHGTCPLPDITVDPERLAGAIDVQDIFVPEDDCTVVEGCVGGSGWRRVIKFATTTPNRGTADLFFGTPGESDLFEFSECHEHYHFSSYAEYRLIAGDGVTVATGRKQAFCLMDFEPDPTAIDSPRARYNCAFQGISLGWQDTYDAYLDCQWIDVTDVPPGDYALEVELNVEQAIPEISYDDDLAQVPLTLLAPEDEPPVTTPCATEASGAYRNCGWTVGRVDTCVPGTTIFAWCNTHQGDPIMRVCDDVDGCRGIEALVNDDDSGFQNAPTATFTCPDDGDYSVLYAPWGDPGAVECDVHAIVQ